MQMQVIVRSFKLQSIWSQMKYHYHNLVHRQILHKERFNTKWEHFEPMSFMYNITVAKIVGAQSGAVNAEANASPANAETTLHVEGSMPSTLPLPLPLPPPLPSATHGRGRPSGSFSWLQTQPSTPPVSAELPHLIQQPPAHAMTYTAFTGLVPPAAVTVEATTTPTPTATATPSRKLGRPSSLHNSMRGRIIDAIKARPSLWAGRQRSEKGQGQSRTSAVWKEAAHEMGLTPTLMQTRWSIIKQRYVDELQKERHAQYGQQGFRSNWEHFERMSFMRDMLLRKVDEREQTREHIQEMKYFDLEGSMPSTLPLPLPLPLPSATHGRGRPSGSFSWLQTQPSTPPVSAELPHLIQQPPAHAMTYTAFTGLVPPAAVTVEATTTPTPTPTATATPSRKLGRPSSLHNSMRGRIIDAIKARPSLWAGRQRSEKGQGQSRTSAVWKEAAHEMGLTPTLMQTRWSIIKQRYVDELQKERHAQYGQQGFRSNWEHFERMSFMRDMLLRKVDEREQTREHIQEMVSEQQQQHPQTQTQTHPHPQSQSQSHLQSHHQLAQQSQHLQLYRPPGLAEHAQDMPIGLVQHQLPHHGALHLHPHHNHHHHHLHHPLVAGVGGGRRRVKHESDLEWDPFEMILHVQGNGETAAN